MKRYVVVSVAGTLVGVALLWMVWGQGKLPGFSPSPARSGQVPSRAANPCNPGTAQATNPCNPGTAQATNPCNPGTAQATNPCNPGTAQATNPCNPGTAQATNPCNPGTAQAANPCNPGTAQAANPCNPGTGGGGAPWERKGPALDWGVNYTSFSPTSGYFRSVAHGNRRVVTYVWPQEAAQVYDHNARLIQQNRTSGFRDYPAGTVLVLESFDSADALAAAGAIGPGRPAGSSRSAATAGNPGAAATSSASGGTPEAAGLVPGPIFFMRKESPGYAREDGDWRYAATDPALRVSIGEGRDGPVRFCQECHSAAKDRGFVYAGGGR
jgi:hypothetical protein